MATTSSLGLYNELEDYEQIWIYHDNPAIRPHDKCFYVAAICPKDKSNLSNTNLAILCMVDYMLLLIYIMKKQK